jgi:hypothetical protein
VRFVRHDGPLDGDGLSWESAFPRIQDGIDAARHAWSSSDNLLACETWVAGGTYYSEYLVPVRLHPGVLVYGGFSGDGHECCREQRRVALHRTVLDGHASAAADAEQAYHVVQGPSPAFTTGLPADCVLDGFVITGGNAHSGDRGDNDHGGGLIVDGKMLGVGMTVRNTIFVDNSARVAGGAIAALDNTSMTLENCIFLRNSAIETAGAVLSAVIGAHVTVRNCDFLDGVAPNGGAVAHAFLGLITVYNSVFWGNELNVTGAFMGGETSIEYSLVEQEIGGEGNLYVPPMIESVDDPVPLPGSPLIDSANGCEAPVLDLRGNARINIAAADDEGILPAADMGAIEYVDGEHEPQGTQLEECCTSVEAPDNAEHIYWFCPSIRSWHRAQDVCAAHGAHLVTLGDAAEQELVLALVESSESPPEEFWLGGHDIAREGHWQWLSGEAWHDWSGFPPSANTDLQDCLVFNRAAGTWTAKLCRGVLERRQFVCESSP